MNKKNNQKISEEQIKKIEREQEQERLSILVEADKIKEETFSFDLDGQIQLKNEIADLVLEEIDNPEAKYQLYYNVVNRLLKKYLPKGKENKKARDLIYEEKNTFLTNGHRKNEKGIRGADGRMGYASNMEELVNIITKWISNKHSIYQLYLNLRDLNVSKGYGEPK